MRVIAALIAIVLFTWMLFALSRDNVPSTAHGRHLFRALFSLAFVSCLFIGARLTSDSLSEEKREGTLGLLFLTDLKGYDVVLGKLAAASLNAFYGLLAIIPVIALTTQLGGVTADELMRASLVLLNTLLLSLSSGMFVSTLSRNERKAMAAVDHVDLVLLAGDLLLRPGPGALLAVEHVGARHVVLARAHQRELDLVLDVLDMEGPALRLAAQQRAEHRVGQAGDQLADARRGRALRAVDREERLGHRHRDLRRLEAHHRAVAADHLVVGVRAARRAARLRNRGQSGNGRGVFLNDLHVNLSRVSRRSPGRLPRFSFAVRTTCYPKS